VREWDGHALWLTIDDKESRKHILTLHRTSTKDSIIASESLELDLEEDISNQIIQGAESHGISPTSYINQIVKRYLEWDRFEPKDDIVTMSKPVVKKLFDNLTEQQIISIANNTAKNALQKTVNKFVTEHQEEGRHKVDMNSFLTWLEDEMNSYAIEIRHIVSKNHEDTTNNSRSSSISIRNNGNHRIHTYILKHDTGYNYSLYYKALLESIFTEVLQKHISAKITSTMLTFEFQEQSF
jgi:hypothetical protein